MRPVDDKSGNYEEEENGRIAVEEPVVQRNEQFPDEMLGRKQLIHGQAHAVRSGNPGRRRETQRIQTDKVIPARNTILNHT